MHSSEGLDSTTVTRTTFEGDAELSRLFDAVLRHPVPTYALGHRLTEMFPALAMIEIDGRFLAEAFAAEGHCAIATRGEFYNQADTYWTPAHGIERSHRLAWLTVTWDGTTFDVVVLTWPGRSYGDEHRHFILGPTTARCDAFHAELSRWNHEVRGEVLVFHEGCFAKSKKLFDAIAAADFHQLVLGGTLVDQIRADFTQFLASRATYEEHGVPWRRGALLVGPPGNGKTLCVKALVRLLAIPCLYIQSFESQHYTVQHSIETVFARARATAPCLVILEDLDALLSEGSRSFFLNELDGFAANTGVITLATTNHPERLDPSIVERPSRFDRKYHFELPDEATRARYIAAWNERLRPALRLSEAGRAEIAALTDGFSFAYIQEVFVASTMRWMVTRDAIGILPVALEQVGLLRAQMQSGPAALGRVV